MLSLKRSPPPPPNLGAAITDFRQRFTLPRKPAQLQLVEHTYRRARADYSALVEESRAASARIGSLSGPNSFDERARLEKQTQDLAPKIEAARTARTEAAKALDAERAKFQPMFLDALGAHADEGMHLVTDALRQVDEALAPLLDAEAFAALNKIDPNRLARVAPLVAQKIRECRQLLAFGSAS